MAPVGTNPAPFLDWGGESRLVTSLSSPGPGWPGIGGMTEDYTKIGTALARGELARELVPISTEESTSDRDCTARGLAGVSQAHAYPPRPGMPGRPP